MFPDKKQWYAVYTRSRAEKRVACEFVKDGIDHYLPLYKTLRQWSDRKKMVELVLVRSYIFVHIKLKQFLPVLQTMGVVTIVHFEGRPVPIPDWQIENLKIIIGANIPISHELSNLQKGKEVRINSGNLKGLRGTVVMIKGRKKLLISIHALNYNMTIDIDAGFVEMV